MFLSAGFLVLLTKGIDLEEACLMAVALGFMLVFRRSFHRVAHATPLNLGLVWFASVAVLFGALFWFGLFAFKHAEYRDTLWWQVSWSGDVSRFMRASLAGATVLAALALNSCSQPAHRGTGPNRCLRRCAR